MWGFPYPEVERGGGWGKGPIKFSDQVYKNSPWEFCTDSTAHYFFTELKNKDQNRIVRTVGSYGTWVGSKRKKIPRKNNYINNNNNGIMGYKRLFNFKKNGKGKQMKPTGWLMHEFSLPDKENNLVLCVIQKKKKKKEEEEEEMGPASAGGDPCSAPTPAPANDHQARWISLMTRAGGQDPYDDQHPLDESPRFSAIDGHSQFQVLDSQEDGLTKKMGSEVEGFDGFDEVEVEGLLLDLADDTEPNFDPLSFLNLLEEEEEMGPASAGGDPCSAPTPAPANDHQALDSEEEETRIGFWLGLTRELPEVVGCPIENFFEGDSYAGVEEGDSFFWC